MLKLILKKAINDPKKYYSQRINDKQICYIYNKSSTANRLKLWIFDSKIKIFIGSFSEDYEYVNFKLMESFIYFLDIDQKQT